LRRGSRCGLISRWRSGWWRIELLPDRFGHGIACRRRIFGDRIDGLFGCGGVVDADRLSLVVGVCVFRPVGVLQV
jgi:hypothetical protein